MLTDRQNAMAIIEWGQPDRVMMRIPGHAVGYLGANQQGYADVGMADGHDRPAGSRWNDIFGVGWHKDYADVMGFPKVHPLAEPRSLARYAWPDPDDERICQPIYDGAKGWDKAADKLLYGSHRSTLWEKAYMLVGMESLLAYFLEEPGFVRDLLRRIMDFEMGIARHYVQAGVEIVGMGDDLGSQNGLLFGMDLFYEFLEPEYRRLFEWYRQHNVKISFHSCGHVEPLLEPFMRLGVHVLNPVQATANDLQKIIGLTRGRMALEGGVSTHLIMEGPVSAIRRRVKESIDLLGADGGYFCSPDQGMPFPKDHYDAFVEAVRDFGAYGSPPPPHR